GAVPPWDLTWDVLRLVLAPALGASLAVMLAIRWLGGERLAPVGAALAMAAGVFAGNYVYSQGSIEWQPDKNRHLTLHDLGTILRWSLEKKEPPEDEQDPPSRWVPRHWLPWLAVLAMLVELVVGLPHFPSNAGWIARTLVAALAGRLLTPLGLREEAPEVPWLIAAAIALEWAV